MNVNNFQQGNALTDVKIQTDIALWRMLLQGIKKPHRLSRVEAFYDLIDRHCIAMLRGSDGHVSGTIHNMAKSWGWDRETVAKFLDNLQQLGVLTVDTDGKRKTVTLNCVIVPEMRQEVPARPSGARTTAPAANGT